MMKGIFPALVLIVAAAPAFAAVEVAPAPVIGLGLPAIAAVLVVGVIGFLLKHTKV
ncbi:MAG TPA: hypothetical protein VFI23_11180 [Rhizomicrobium sp.]|nr:hypothetical protein [Rhizomicrobium sp.]